MSQVNLIMEFSLGLSEEDYLKIITNAMLFLKGSWSERWIVHIAWVIVGKNYIGMYRIIGVKLFLVTRRKLL